MTVAVSFESVTSRLGTIDPPQPFVVEDAPGSYEPLFNPMLGFYGVEIVEQGAKL